MAVVNLTGVTTESPNEWIRPIKNADGSFQPVKYTLKITEITEDGYSDSGDPKYKFIFKTADGKIFSENFSMAPNLSWKFKRFTVAMQAPDVFDLAELAGRYVICTIGGRTHNGKDYTNVEAWEYASQNANLAPIKPYQDEATALAEEAELAF